MQNWELLFEEKIKAIAAGEDPAHDLLHFKRVVQLAKRFCVLEKADINIVLPAAWLHDFVIVPKDSPLRSQASQLSADAAISYLKEINYPEKYFSEIAHAIAAHSFSANIETKTIEAKIVQDADRLDGLGAIGISRCFATAGLLKRSFYSDEDAFCNQRAPDDQKFTVDHFYKKLFKTAETLKTESARTEGQRRLNIMKKFLEDLKEEI